MRSIYHTVVVHKTELAGRFLLSGANVAKTTEVSSTATTAAAGARYAAMHQISITV